MPRTLLLLHTVALVEWVRRLRLHLRVLQLGRATTVPVVASRKWRRRRSWWRVLCVGTPLWARWPTQGVWLIRLRVHVLRCGHASLARQAVGGLTLEQRQTGLDVDI